MSFQKSCFSDFLNRKRKELGEKIVEAVKIFKEVEIECLKYGEDENDDTGVFVNVEIRLPKHIAHGDVAETLRTAGFVSCGDAGKRYIFVLPTEKDLDVRVFIKDKK